MEHYRCQKAAPLHLQKVGLLPRGTNHVLVLQGALHLESFQAHLAFTEVEISQRASASFK
jgi:hypothetical protein